MTINPGTIIAPAHAASLTVHVSIDPPVTLTSADHRAIPEGDGFAADTVLWNWGRPGSRVSLHARGVRYCLAYYPEDGDQIPSWLPRPPAAWDAAAAAFIATVTEAGQ